MGEKEEKPRVRITQQFREKNNMAYDFDCAGASLTLRVFQSEEAANPEEWRMEARTSDAPEAAVITASGATRAAALDELARTWTATEASRGLPTFDWAAVARAMVAVRAV